MNKKHIVALAVLLITVFFTACKDNTTLVSAKPQITLGGQSPSVMTYGSAKDTLIIKYGFTDDQDLSSAGVFLTLHFDKGGDSIIFNNLQFPTLPDGASLVDPVRGISGVAYIIIPTPLIYFSDTNKAKKNLPSYVNASFYLRDADGNNSDTLTTDKFYIKLP